MGRWVYTKHSTILRCCAGKSEANAQQDVSYARKRTRKSSSTRCRQNQEDSLAEMEDSETSSRRKKTWNQNRGPDEKFLTRYPTKESPEAEAPEELCISSRARRLGIGSRTTRSRVSSVHTQNDLVCGHVVLVISFLCPEARYEANIRQISRICAEDLRVLLSRFCL